MDTQANLEQDSVKKLILVKNRLKKLYACVIRSERFIGESRGKKKERGKPVRVRERAKCSCWRNSGLRLRCLKL